MGQASQLDGRDNDEQHDNDDDDDERRALLQLKLTLDTGRRVEAVNCGQRA